MSTYRAQIPAKYVDWLTAPLGELGTAGLSDQVRDAETDPDRGYEPGWTYFDNSAIAHLRTLSDDDDGCISDDEHGIRIWFEGTPYDLEVVRS